VVEQIVALHKLKGYKVETLYIAVSITDRYLSFLNQRRVTSPPNLTSLATISILMAAKLEQPVSPSFNRMINLLPESKRVGVTKEGLIDLEFNIVASLEFSV